MNVAYLNLTNGLEYLWSMPDAKVVRIQSTHLEQSLYSKVIEDLDYQFLMDLVLGKDVWLFDKGSRRSDGVSRAIWQGVPFIKVTLHKHLKLPTVPDATLMNGHNALVYFSQLHLSEAARKKIKYFRKFVNTDRIYLTGVSDKTDHDGDYNYYREILTC